MIFLGQVVAMGAAVQVVLAREADRRKATVVAYGSNSAEKAPLAYYLGQCRHLSSSYRKPSLPDLAAHVYKRA